MVSNLRIIHNRHCTFIYITYIWNFISLKKKRQEQYNVSIMLFQWATTNFVFFWLVNGYIHICMYIHNTWEHLNKYSNFNSSTTYKTSRKLANYHLRTKLDMSLISKCDPICRIITWCFYVHWQFLWTFKNKPTFRIDMTEEAVITETHLELHF